MIMDGSHGEGGGQILRTAIALSCITGKDIEIKDIRANRPNPGLAAQHLAGLQAASRITHAKAEGLRIGSTSIKFSPGPIEGGFHSVDIGTAGAITLVLQTIVIPSLKAEEMTVFEITGGTDVPWSPSIAYFQHIFCDFMKRMGIDIGVEILKYGFYPKGGGKVRVSLSPQQEIKPLNFTERGKLERIDTWSIASENLRNARVAERQVEGAREFLKYDFGKSNIIYTPTLSPGSSVHIHAHFKNCKLGASSLGERGTPAENVGGKAARLLKKQIDSGACLDEWMADQIIPYLALYGGKVSVSEITEHAKTNIWVCEQFGAKFEVEGDIISVLATV
jgi:RNA 3'-terminal phosphate cyclase (GTP)